MSMYENCWERRELLCRDALNILQEAARVCVERSPGPVIKCVDRDVARMKVIRANVRSKAQELSSHFFFVDRSRGVPLDTNNAPESEEVGARECFRGP